MTLGRAATLLMILVSAPFALAAEAPTPAQIEARLEVINLKRQKLFSDYRMGELMMKNAQLEDAPLKAEEDQLKKMIAEVKK